MRTVQPITGLPIVLLRGFHHGAIVCSRRSTLKGPDDLKGKRVGVRAYSQTTGVWVRGILQSEYGIDPASITWVTEEAAHVEQYRDPPNVVRTQPGESLHALLLTGEIDAAIGLRQADPKDVRTVIPDADDAASAWYRKTGTYPVNHVLAVRNDLLAAHPWLGLELFAMFTAAKQHARATAAPVVRPDPALARLMSVVGDDPLPHGMAANRRSIETLLEFAAEQALTPTTYRAPDLFVQAC